MRGEDNEKSVGAQAWCSGRGGGSMRAAGPAGRAWGGAACPPHEDLISLSAPPSRTLTPGQAIREEIERVSLEAQQAERDYDLNRAAGDAWGGKGGRGGEGGAGEGSNSVTHAPTSHG